MKTLCSLPFGWPSLIYCSLFLLSACLPTTTPSGPSAALKQQFDQMQQQQRQQAEQIQALQQQLAQLRPSPTSSVPAVAKQTAAKPFAIPAAISEEITALADSASTYLAAFSSLAAGRYLAAETGFSGFISKYPEHQYTPNARYWLASALWAQNKLQAAASNLRQVIVDNNGQERAPAALLLLAKIYRQQQFNNEADEVLEQLRRRYPESTEAQQFYRGDEAPQ